MWGFRVEWLGIWARNEDFRFGTVALWIGVHALWGWSSDWDVGFWGYGLAISGLGRMRVLDRKALNPMKIPAINLRMLGPNLQ